MFKLDDLPDDQLTKLVGAFRRMATLFRHDFEADWGLLYLDTVAAHPDATPIGVFQAIKQAMLEEKGFPVAPVTLCSYLKLRDKQAYLGE